MELKGTLLELLKNKKVIGLKNKRKYCWKDYFDEECQIEFEKYSKNYRSEDEAWFCLTHDCEPPVCKVCQKEYCVFTGRKKAIIPGYQQVCSNCSIHQNPEKIEKMKKTFASKSKEEKQKSKEKARQTCLERYGDENYSLFGSKSFKENLKEKYGDENYNNREKCKQTCLERYGVDHNFKLKNYSKENWEANHDKILEKARQTNIEKYGTEYFFNSDRFKEECKKTIIEKYGSYEEFNRNKKLQSQLTKIERYGDLNYHNVEKFKVTLEERHHIFEIENNCTRKPHLLKKYGQGWQSLNLPELSRGRYKYIENKYIPIIQEYSNEVHQIHNKSKSENELYEYLKSILKNKYRIYRNNRNILKGDGYLYEIDIYIPKLKIAFEYNGNYWHSSNRKPKDYHQIKTKMCYEKNIQLVHIYEYDWVNNKEKIKNQICELFDGKDCSKYNWIKVEDYNKYILSEPEETIVNHGSEIYKIYNEGKFILKNLIL